MPNRVIRDVALSSRKLSAASDFAERLYWRIFQAADDFGRFQADPVLLLARCFPLQIGRMKPSKVKSGRDELARLGLIVHYRGETDEYLEVTTWNQRVRSNSSKFPGPNDGHMTVICQSSACPDEDRGSRIEDRRRGLVKPPTAVVDEAFSRFWIAYPRKQQKQDALKAWGQTSGNGRPEIEPLVAIVAAHVRSKSWAKAIADGEIHWIPLPATWLRGHQWEDILDPGKPQRKTIAERARDFGIPDVR